MWCEKDLTSHWWLWRWEDIMSQRMGVTSLRWKKKERKEKIFFRRVLMHFKHIQSCFKVSITWYWWRNGHIDKLNRIENYVSNAYGNLVCDKGDISIKYRGSYLCNKCTRLIGYISNKDQGKIVFMYHTMRNSKWVRDLNIKS